jgi:hypothetical protein
LTRVRHYYIQDQRDELISYIVNDKLSIAAASKKAKMNHVSGYYHYHKYFKEQNPNIATPSHIATLKCYTQEQIKQVISYIVEVTIAAALRKANDCDFSAKNTITNI